MNRYAAGSRDWQRKPSNRLSVKRKVIKDIGLYHAIDDLGPKQTEALLTLFLTREWSPLATEMHCLKPQGAMLLGEVPDLS